MGIRQQQASPVSKTDAVISIFHSCCRQAWKTSWAVYSHTETAADVQSGKSNCCTRLQKKQEQHERHNRNSRTSAKKIFLLPHTAPDAAVHWLWTYIETDSCWMDNCFTHLAEKWQHKILFGQISGYRTCRSLIPASQTAAPGKTFIASLFQH